MGNSKYLQSLNPAEYKQLKAKLLEIQNHKCFICQDEIDLHLHENDTDIDHIIPLTNQGKDSIENFGLTHASCNRSKQDSNLNIARLLCFLTRIQEKTRKEEEKSASLKQVLQKFGGSKYAFNHKIENGIINYSFPQIEDNKIYSTLIFTDNKSKEKTCFIEVPIEYLYHDELINPRGINSSISKLIKEFYKGNPQLHLSIGRIDNENIKIFDGQHKAVAQILLGSKKLLIRLFINPDVKRLIETNTNAGSTLRQIAFDKSILRQLNNALYDDKVETYRKDHELDEENLDFSEQDLVRYFKGDKKIKKLITDSIKESIMKNGKNKLFDFIDMEGRSKELPISYSTFDKTILSIFIDSKNVLSTPIGYKADEGCNPRELEIDQVVTLLNILAEEIYIGKFNEELGVSRIEQKLIDKNDAEISDDHLIAYRISKEEIMYNWVWYLKKVIENYFLNTGQKYDENSLFQQPFNEQLWKNLRAFIQNLHDLPLWKDRGMASTIFAGKKNYDYWEKIFQTGKSPDGASVLMKPINYLEMIKNHD